MSTQAGKGSGMTVAGNGKKQTWPYVSRPSAPHARRGQTGE
jgi:hypothetical protein